MRVLVTGGTGFVGTHLVNALGKRGHRVAVLARRPEAARNRYNHPVEAVAGDVLDPASLTAAAAGRDAAIHLVGIIEEKGGQTFDALHREGAENVVAALAAAGVPRLLHMSAMGSFDEAPAAYARTKAAGERAVRSSRLAWTVFRPSIVFGPGDGFVSLLADVVRKSPLVIPVIGSGKTRFQPVSVYDVARVFCDALEKPETSGQAFEVGGPEIFTLNAIYREIAAALGLPRKPLLHLPLWWGRFVAARFEAASRRGWIDQAPITRDQLASLSRDSVGEIAPTQAVFGGPWREFRPGIREYLTPVQAPDPRFGIGGEVDLEPVRTLRIR